MQHFTEFQVHLLKECITVYNNFFMTMPSFDIAYGVYVEASRISILLIQSELKKSFTTDMKTTWEIAKTE